jgi:DNA-binding MarR family transcriptional regulator
MNLQKFVDALGLASAHGLDASDIVILYDVGTAAEGEGTIMKIVGVTPSIMSKATRHERIKRLCKRGFLVKKEMPANMRKKVIELSEEGIFFLKMFNERLV